ncbi:TPA: DUF551 domain-containing protein [Klebsiella aerogenes]|nr:DUF551 domain-containing protein [Klebsiella aerogenes]
MDGEPVAKKVACWSCQNEVEISAIGDCDGCCPNCNSPIDLDEEPYAAPQPAPVVPDEREAFEAFVAKRFGDLVDQRRAKNGDHGYMAWDMVVAWTVWQARAMLQAEPVTTANKLGNSSEQGESRCGTKGSPALDSSSKNAESRCGNSPVIPDTWIPVSERMPEDEEQYYLTYSEGDGVCRSYFFDGYFSDQYITHWMPLPAAPQEVK